MAKVVGPLHSTFASGKYGDIVFSRNQHGMYTRQNGFVVDPNTSEQQIWRNALSSLQSEWKNDSIVTQEKKNMWHSFAQNWPISTKFGRKVFGSGRDWYIKLNIFRNIRGLGSHTTPPRNPSCNYFPEVSFSQEDDGIYASVNPFPIGEQAVYISYVPEQSTARRFMPNKQRLLYLITSSDSNPVKVLSNADISEETSRYFFKFKSIDVVGRQSTHEIIYHDFSRVVLNIDIFCENYNNIISNVPDNVYNSDTNFTIIEGSSTIRRSIFRFDLSSIPDNSIIISSILNFYISYMSSYVDRPIHFSHLLVNNNVDFVTWNNRDDGLSWSTPGLEPDVDYDSYTYHIIVNSTGWKQIELTEITQYFVSNPLSNYGIFLFTTTSTYIIIYTPISGKKPFLSISYYLP